MAQAWKTVRIFISSTFRDMHAERDLLVRLVFPELRERCARRRLHLADVDLRWGVTEEETRQGKVLEICLDEIERCRPFFIGLLGERYGWVPPKYEVTDAPRYDWVREFEGGHSITALEIYYGVLRTPDMRGRAFFYFRDPAFMSEVPEDYRAMFLAESAEAVLKLQGLKSEISKYSSVFENYPCYFSGIGAGGNVKLGGLEAFGERVLEDLWLGITAEYPQEAISTDELAIERTYHEVFIENRTQRFIGRSELLGQMTSYAGSDNQEPLLVVGAPGSGKSALLANFARKYAAAHPETFVLPHFIGISPGSPDIRRTLLRLCRELAHHFDIGDEIPENYEQLRQSFAQLLEQAGSRGRLVLILDALNQLDETHNAYALDWLPPRLPPGVCLIASALEGDCLEALRRRSAPTEITVGTLAPEDRRDIVRQTLWESRKRLDERPEANQMELLLNKGESHIPLYLIVACEELRLFGNFELVTERIAGFPDDIPGLFQQVLGRLEADHGRELVEQALSLLECSRYGLLETEMLELLRRTGETQLPRALWARLYRSLQPYLHPPGESGDDALNFFHQQLSQAVRQRYLEAEKEKTCHQTLAIYFHRKADPSGDATWSGIYPRGLSELPYHQMQGEMWEQLATIAADETFILKQRQEVDMVAVDETLRLGIAAGLIVGEQRRITEVLSQRRRHFSAEQLGEFELSNKALTRQDLISLLQITRRLARPMFSARVSLLLAWNALEQRQLDLCARGVAQFIECGDGYLAYEEAHLFSTFFLQAWRNDVAQVEEAWIRAYPKCFAATSILRALISLSDQLPSALVALYQRLHQSAPETVPSLPARPTLSEMEKALADAIKEELNSTTDPGLGTIGQLLKVDLDGETGIALPAYLGVLQRDLKDRSGSSVMPGLLDAYQRVLKGESLSVELAEEIALPEVKLTDAKLQVAQAAELALLAYDCPNRDGSELLVRRIANWMELNEPKWFTLGGSVNLPYREPQREQWTHEIQIFLCIFAWARRSNDQNILSLIARASRVFMPGSGVLVTTRIALASSLATEDMPLSLIRELLECHRLGSGLQALLSEEEAWILGFTLNLTGALSLSTRLAALNDESNILENSIRSFATVDVDGAMQLIKNHLRETTGAKRMSLAAVLSAIWCGQGKTLLPLIAKLQPSAERDLLYYALVMQPEESNRLEYLPLIASPHLRFGAARLLGASTNRNAAYWQGVSGFKSTVLPFGDAILSVCEEETAAKTATLFALNALHQTK